MDERFRAAKRIVERRYSADVVFGSQPGNGSVDDSLHSRAAG